MNKLTIIKTSRLVFKNYTYLIVNEASKQGILIDPAWELAKYNEALKVDNIKLSAILLTHHHLDHSHLANDLAIQHECPVYMAQDEIQYYQFKCNNLQPIPSDCEFFDIAGISIRVIATPGHTYGGVCYLIDNQLFTGDTLFNEGCGICNTKGGNPRQMYDSLQKFKSVLSKDTLIYPGHEFKYPIGQSFDFLMKNNIYMQINDIEDFIKFRMRKGQTSFLNFT
jgi:hydroxyacylglutathione hydrolase